MVQKLFLIVWLPFLVATAIPYALLSMVHEVNLKFVEWITGIQIVEEE